MQNVCTFATSDAEEESFPLLIMTCAVHPCQYMTCVVHIFYKFVFVWQALSPPVQYISNEQLILEKSVHWLLCT